MIIMQYMYRVYNYHKQWYLNIWGESDEKEYIMQMIQSITQKSHRKLTETQMINWKYAFILHNWYWEIMESSTFIYSVIF